MVLMASRCSALPSPVSCTFSLGGEDEFSEVACSSCLLVSSMVRLINMRNEEKILSSRRRLRKKRCRAKKSPKVNQGPHDIIYESSQRYGLLSHVISQAPKGRSAELDGDEIRELQPVERRRSPQPPSGLRSRKGDHSSVRPPQRRDDLHRHTQTGLTAICSPVLAICENSNTAVPCYLN